MLESDQLLIVVWPILRTTIQSNLTDIFGLTYKAVEER